MKPSRVSSGRFSIAAALVVLTLLTCAAWATSAGAAPGKYEIVPGESIGYAALGMTRKTIQHKLKNPIAHSHDARFYYLSYHYPAHDRIGNPGGKLTIVFHGLSRGAHAVYMVTVEPSLGTRPEHIGVGDTFSEMKGAYPGVTATTATRTAAATTTSIPPRTSSASCTGTAASRTSHSLPTTPIPVGTSAGLPSPRSGLTNAAGGPVGRRRPVVALRAQANLEDDATVGGCQRRAGSRHERL